MAQGLASAVACGVPPWRRRRLAAGAFAAGRRQVGGRFVGAARARKSAPSRHETAASTRRLGDASARRAGRGSGARPAGAASGAAGDAKREGVMTPCYTPRPGRPGILVWVRGRPPPRLAVRTGWRARSRCRDRVGPPLGSGGAARRARSRRTDQTIPRPGRPAFAAGGAPALRAARPISARGRRCRCGPGLPKVVVGPVRVPVAAFLPGSSPLRMRSVPAKGAENRHSAL